MSEAIGEPHPNDRHHIHVRRRQQIPSPGFVEPLTLPWTRKLSCVMAVPSWKQSILDKRRKQEEEEQRRKKDEEAKLSAVPAWKRSILRRKDGSKAPGPGSSVSRVPFGLKTPGTKPLEKTPADSKARPHSEQTIAKRIEETQKTLNGQPIPKAPRWIKTANGSAAVEKKPSNATTPPWGKVTLRKTVSNEPAPSKASPSGQIKRWPVVQPPNALTRSSVSLGNVKREIAEAVGVSRAATQSKDSPTIRQRKETYQSQVTKATSSPTKQRKVKKTSLPNDKLPVDLEAAQPVEDRPVPLKRGSVKSLMGFFQGGSSSNTASKATSSSFISGSVSSGGMVSKHTEQGYMDRKFVKDSKAELNVTQTTVPATSLEENSKTDVTVPAGSDHSLAPPGTIDVQKAVLERPEEHIPEARPSDLKAAALREEPLEKPLQTAIIGMVNHTEESLQTSNTDAELSAMFISVHDQDVHLVEKEQPTEPLSSPTLGHISNGSVTQWEEEEEGEQLTVTSIDDIDTDEENDQSQEKQTETEIPALLTSKENDQSTGTENNSSLASTPIKATPVPPSDPALPVIKDIVLLSIHRDERRSSATLEPTKQADVSDVIGDAVADIEQGSVQNSDSESTGPVTIRKKSSLASMNKYRVCQLGSLFDSHL